MRILVYIMAVVLCLPVLILIILADKNYFGLIVWAKEEPIFRLWLVSVLYGVATVIFSFPIFKLFVRFIIGKKS